MKKLLRKFLNVILLKNLESLELKLSINFSLSNDLKSSISGADCIAFMTGHECFKDKGLNFFAKHSKKGCLIFDGRRYFSRKEINQILDEGMNYRGIGRCA